MYLLLVEMERKTCFHCNRRLLECVENDQGDYCNYCGIIANLMRESSLEGDEEEEENVLNEVFLLFFLVLVIGTILFIYFFRDEAYELFYVIQEKLKNMFSLVFLHNQIHFSKQLFGVFYYQIVFNWLYTSSNITIMSIFSVRIPFTLKVTTRIQITVQLSEKKCIPN